ncbi:hypothetical protein DL768_003057 [Monosporascus sp. mg162]|nr:hypothetical protein DL768_003057 [Monosporascus sp. mg162]
MASTRLGCGSLLLILGIILILMPGKAAAFGAGNIPSIAQVEGHNWRHGDIEDMLKTVAFVYGKKWSSLSIRRTYFGNWLRDYSQAVDVGSLKGVNAETIRILVWVLSFLANGYATEEFEVTAERLGVYRPEEHIDNPLGYADGMDAREFDPRLRGPVMPEETEIDRRTGMKNYIANERGGWATSAGYLRFSFGRSIHYGRLYTSGSRGRGKEEDLCEALRCLGQALHCMEDFSAHSNYCELALRELGYRGVFPHCGENTEIDLWGKRVFPLVTGTFGGVDFLHSVLGEANDHFTQTEVSEVDQLDLVLRSCEKEGDSSQRSGEGGSRGLLDVLAGSLFGGGGRSGAGNDFISLVTQLPDSGDGFASEARSLKARSEEQQRRNELRGDLSRDNANIVPGMSESFDPVKVSKQIYPILQFRDKIVKAINRIITKIPGLENLIEKISETLTAFVLGLLAPFIRPIISQVTKTLKEGSSNIIDSSANSQLEPWRNPQCTDPTHSMLSKDHFTHILNPCAGRVAAAILQYVVPRIMFAWENPGVPEDEVVDDVLRAFHHPAIRDNNIEIQREMFDTVRKWAEEYPERHELNRILGSESVKNGENHVLFSGESDRSRGHSHGSGLFDGLGHGRPSDSLWTQVKARDLDEMGVGAGHNRPGSSSSPALPAAGPKYGYTQNRPPRGGEAEGYYYDGAQSSYGQPHSSGYGARQDYGGPPPGHYRQHSQHGYGAPPPAHYSPYEHQGYEGAPPQHGQHYGGAPPHHGGHYGGAPPPGPYPGSAYGGPPPPHQEGYPPYGRHQQWGSGYGHPPYPY